MSTVADTVARKMRACEAEVKAASRTGVRDASLVLKDGVLVSVRRVTGGDGRLGRMGNANLGAKFDIRQVEDRHTAKLQATGPWQIVENDTDPHFITAGLLGAKGSTRAGRQRAAALAGSVAAFGGSARGVFGGMQSSTYQSRKGGTRVRKGKRAMVIGGNLRAYAAHPGTRGRQPWRRGIDTARPAALQVLQRAEITAVVRGFRR